MRRQLTTRGVDARSLRDPLSSAGSGKLAHMAQSAAVVVHVSALAIARTALAR
jgi:hypothetical protein